MGCALRQRKLELPSLIGPYVILREIGSGGMGSVYCGIQHCPEREVAVKVMQDGIFADDLTRAKFLSEREIAGRFEHPHIIRVYDAGEDQDGQLYYVMEYARRGTLADHVRSARLSHVNAVRMIIEVAFAVDYAHGLGVLHRDLKPSNILIGDDLRPRVTDFGVAKLIGVPEHGAFREPDADEVDQHTLVGSFPYMSPEQAGWRPQPTAAHSVTRASDVYSLGAILYELLCGKAPYAVRTRDELCAAFASGPASTLRSSRVSYELEAVVMTALEHDPDRRYPSAAAFAEDLRRTLSGQRTVERPRSARGRMTSWARRHASWISLGLGAWLVMVGIVLALSQQMLHASVRHNHHVQRQTAQVAASLLRIFKDVSAQAQQLAHDPHTQRMLTQGVTGLSPSADDTEWLTQSVKGVDLINSAFLAVPTGTVVAHVPAEPGDYYKRDYHNRVYFRCALSAASADQGLGHGVCVSPVFRSRASGTLLKLAFAAPVYAADHALLGIAVMTVTLDALAHELQHPALALLVPHEVESGEELSAEPSVAQGKVVFDAQGRARLALISQRAQSLYVTKVVGTGYAIMADIEVLALSQASYSVWFWLAVAASTFGLAWLLLRRGAVRES